MYSIQISLEIVLLPVTILSIEKTFRWEKKSRQMSFEMNKVQNIGKKCEHTCIRFFLQTDEILIRACSFCSHRNDNMYSDVRVQFTGKFFTSVSLSLSQRKWKFSFFLFPVNSFRCSNVTGHKHFILHENKNFFCLFFFWKVFLFAA